MILLDKKDYHKATDALKKVTFNNLFARSVVEQKANGRVYADSTTDPQTFYIVHSYGMSLLFGDHTNKEFNEAFRKYALNIDGIRSNHEWLQAFPSSWDRTLTDLFKDHIILSEHNKDNLTKGVIELNTRVNFKFDKEKYLSLRLKTPKGISLVKTDEKIFANMKGSVVPEYFWKSAADFVADGLGYSLYYNGKLASTAYSSFIHDDKFELGIETVSEFRGKGLAYYACAALIDHCIANNLEPIWACRLENIGSYKLALKLGFEDVLHIPYYRLSN